ncbi:DoxX family protein [uncultured Erythrobacter sp.]|uniref:DoxX family protein n=1 Tax=uncultured Erythrobacter sp. TaxID=263913 RepID=UPI00260A19A1|nr:DoxX family protein [uncultured Erythrobacter sp.]
MTNQTSSILYAIGRAGLASLFILGGVNKILNFDTTLATIEATILTPPLLFLVGTIDLELIFGLALALGTRFAGWAALGLAVFTLATNVLFHRFWEMSGEVQALELSLFFKNIAIVGALLALASIEDQRQSGTKQAG